MIKEGSIFDYSSLNNYNISILGDSISTYQGTNPEGYAVYYNEEMQRRNRLASFSDTWWGRVCPNITAFSSVMKSKE